MTDVEVLQTEVTLRAAVHRLETLRTRAALTSPAEPDDEPDAGDPGAAPLTRAEALELLALGEVIARKAVAGRQLDIRTARQVGASWAEIGRALGSTRQSAWGYLEAW